MDIVQYRLDGCSPCELQRKLVSDIDVDAREISDEIPRDFRDRGLSVVPSTIVTCDDGRQKTFEGVHRADEFESFCRV